MIYHSLVDDFLPVDVGVSANHAIVDRNLVVRNAAVTQGRRGKASTSIGKVSRAWGKVSLVKGRRGEGSSRSSIGTKVTRNSLFYGIVVWRT